MARSSLAVWGAASILTVCLLVGAPVVFSEESVTLGPAWLWWACYLGFLALFTATLLDDAPQRTGRSALLLALAASGAATVLLGARAAWLAILLVFVTAVAAHRTSLRHTIALLGVNSTVAGAAPLLRDGAVMDVTLTASLYTMLQVCAVWAVRSERREVKARERLAVANTELRAATALLAESSRSAERLRIARELHDLVGHQLTALVLELERLLQATGQLPDPDEPHDVPPQPLTDREQDVLRLLAAGYANREIADALHLAEGTVKNHVSSVLAKLGVRDRTRAVLKALHHGLLADAPRNGPPS